MKIQLVCLTIAVCLGFAGSANASLVTGGGFNNATDLGEWTFAAATTNNASVFGQLAPIEGASYVRFTGIPGNGFAYQDVNVTNGQMYRLDFSYGGGDNATGNIGINVQVGGGALHDMTYGATTGVFTGESVIFTATADGLLRIQFSEDSTDSDGEFAAVDGVSLVAIPEPGSLLLFGVALVGLPFTRRRK